MSSTLTLAREAQTIDATGDVAGDREVREMALFLIRIFGEEASEVAAERAEKSEQAEEWRRVWDTVDRLLAESPIDEMERRPLRLVL